MRQPFPRIALPLLLVGLLLGTAAPSVAQTVELAPFFGCRVGGGLAADRYSQYDPALYQDFDLAASSGYGVVADVALTPRFKVEGLVSQQRTKIEAPGFFGPQDPPMVVDEYLFGAAWEFGHDLSVPPARASVAGSEGAGCRLAAGATGTARPRRVSSSRSSVPPG